MGRRIDKLSHSKWTCDLGTWIKNVRDAISRSIDQHLLAREFIAKGGFVTSNHDSMPGR